MHHKDRCIRLPAFPPAQARETRLVLLWSGKRAAVSVPKGAAAVHRTARTTQPLRIRVLPIPLEGLRRLCGFSDGATDPHQESPYMTRVARFIRRCLPTPTLESHWIGEA